jgi:hypothetical protein
MQAFPEYAQRLVALLSREKLPVSKGVEVDRELVAVEAIGDPTPLIRVELGNLRRSVRLVDRDPDSKPGGAQDQSRNVRGKGILSGYQSLLIFHLLPL